MFRKKRYGQVFATPMLTNIIMDEIKKQTELDGKTVLEIGPGAGKLTDKILSCNVKKLTVIEKDFDYYQFLKNAYEHLDNFECIHGDILKYNPVKTDIIIGNIPYNISSKLLLHMQGWKFGLCFICFQKEFVERMCTAPGYKQYSRLAAMAQYYYDINIIRKLSRSLFCPVPKVDSVMLMFKRKKVALLSKCTQDLVNIIFTNKRQTFKKSVSHALSKNDAHSFLLIFSELYGQALIRERVFNINGEKIFKACEKWCATRNNL